MNLVVGATGETGIEVCRRLIAAGKPVRALVRPASNPQRVEELKTLGAELIEGDLKDGPSLDAACCGIDAVLTTATMTQSKVLGDSIRSVDREGCLRLVEAAQKAGVSRFVYLSFRNGHVDYPLALAKRLVEESLRSSGMVYTILRGSWFDEVWLTPELGFDYVGGKATIYGPGTARISWVSYTDVARMMAESLDSDYARNQTIEVGGPEPLTPLEVVAIFEEVAGRRFEVEHVQLENLQTMRDNAPDELQESIAGLMLHYASGDEVDTTEISRAFSIRFASVRDYAERVLAPLSNARRQPDTSRLD